MNEEQLIKLGTEAGNLYIDGKMELKDAVVKIAGEWGLNKEQINRVVGVANHRVFSKLSQEDRTLSFNVVSTDDVYDKLHTKEASIKNIEKIPVSVSPEVKQTEKNASKKEEDIHKTIEKFRMVKKARIGLCEVIDKLAMEKTEADSALYKTILKLLKGGDDIEEIWKYISAAFGKNDQLKERFEKIVDLLHGDGYIATIPDFDDGDIKDTPVDKDTELFKEINKALVVEKSTEEAKGDLENVDNYLEVTGSRLKEAGIIVSNSPFISTKVRFGVKNG